MKYPKRWKTRDGEKIAIEDMSTRHIKNTLAMLERNGWVGKELFEFAMFGPTPDEDSCAYQGYMFEVGILAERKVTPFVDWMEQELEDRKQSADIYNQ